MSASKTRYFYVKVIEARGIVSNALREYTEPFVTIKFNGQEWLHKKSTCCRTGVEWWEQTFRFKTKSVDTDWIAVEIREKGLNLISSDWIGEVQLHVSTFKDGQVHEHWFKMGKGNWKNHSREPKGFLRLAFQLKENKYDRPFQQEPTGRMSFAEWQQAGMPMPPLKALEPTVTHKGDQEPYVFHSTFETITEAEKQIGNSAWKIVMSEHPSQKELQEMKKLNRVNCLHKGNFDNCTGKRYMVCIDGSVSSREAFNNTLRLIDPKKDHLFIVTVRERHISDDFFEEKNRIILDHKLWQAAAGIISVFQDQLKEMEEPKIDFTTIVPEADDAREMVCALVVRYKVDILVVSKHKDYEARHHSLFFRSFQQYCQKNAKCTVMTF